MLNQCNFIGRVGRTPEIRYSAAGTACANFSLAVDERFKNKSGEWETKTEWVNFVYWGKQAETIGQYVEQGALLFCTGRFGTRKWIDRDGKERYSSEITGAEFKMLGTKGSKDGSKDGGKPRSGGDGSRTYDREPVFDDTDSIPF